MIYYYIAEREKKRERKREKKLGFSIKNNSFQSINNLFHRNYEATKQIDESDKDD